MDKKNYITPQGLRRLRTELKTLRTDERPKLTETISWAAGNGDRSENGDYIYGKKRLREIDRRIRFLLKRVENAEVIDPALLTGTEVRFGATVTIADEEGAERTYSIVGTDEGNLEKQRISWQSPLAKAILRKQEGDVLMFRAPSGEQEIEIVRVEYVALD